MQRAYGARRRLLGVAHSYIDTGGAAWRELCGGVASRAKQSPDVIIGLLLGVGGPAVVAGIAPAQSGRLLSPAARRQLRSVVPAWRWVGYLRTTSGLVVTRRSRYPSRRAVNTTRILCPLSALRSRYFRSSAPRMRLPSRNQ